MWKYCALISYVGTDFCGWQKQKQVHSGPSPSIQATIEGVIQKITGELTSVVGSGRTDSGVHSIGQVAHFVLRQKHWSTSVLQNAFNSQLPQSIRVLCVAEVALEFHAQRSAEKKQYSYYFQQGPSALPHLQPYSWWIRKALDQKAMQRALQHLVGEHDFKPFQAAGANPGPTVRSILEAEVETIPVMVPPFNEISLVRVRVLGTGFLKQMVRGIAGTLLQVGEGRRDPDCTQMILETQNRGEVGPTAPARALWLEQVWYPKQAQLPWSV